MLKRLTLALALSGLWCCAANAEGLNRPAVNRFIGEMASQPGFNRASLHALFAKVRFIPSVIAAISKPAEALPWYKYRRIFLTHQRIEGGVEFWSQHAAALQRAETRFGVPAEVIVAILGVETLYGRRTGHYRVMDALSTLAFNYPQRAGFFRSELRSFLLLTHQQGIDPLSVTGSYAGAMGLPQFIASSYLAYAIDFNGDGRKDLWRDPSDAIGSVANYLSKHGWERGQLVAVPARVDGHDYASLLKKGLEPTTPLRKVEADGVTPKQPIKGDPAVALLALESGSGNEYWIGLRNFYVITRYNRSPLYAMAVLQLAQAIRQAHRVGAAGLEG